MPLRNFLKRRFVSKAFEQQISRIKKPVGSLGFDPWGFNLDTLEITLALFSTVYHKYFRVQTQGLAHVPATGPVLIVANHSGQLPIDGTLIAYAVSSRAKDPRIPRAMIERFFPTVPWLGNFLNGLGAVLGDPINCAKMLENDEAIIVFPEGIRGSGKMYKDRYQLKRFGNGFMHLAMKYQATVVPVGVVGCEETMPAIANIAPLAKLLGIPYVPVALPFPLPAKVSLTFGEPMTFPNDNVTEDQVTMRVEQVKAAISELIDQGLKERKTLF